MSFLTVIPNVIANKIGVELSGCQHNISMEGGMVRVSWSVGEEKGEAISFRFYSDGAWDFENYETGEYKEGRVTPPTHKTWISRIAKKYWPEYGYAAWIEWKSLKQQARRSKRR